MMNAYRKQECPVNAPWYTIQGVLAKTVLDRELPIVQAIPGNHVTMKHKFKDQIFALKYNYSPCLKAVDNIFQNTKCRNILI
jgi:hypothetical protein